MKITGSNKRAGKVRGIKKTRKLAGLSLTCPKCKGTAHKQYHCKMPTYFCVECNESIVLPNEFVEQERTNTRQFKDIANFFK